MISLRLATYNLRDLLDDVDAVREVLRALEADVVCVQELPRTPIGDHQARRLARATGYRAPRTHRGGGGTSVLVGPRMDVASVRHLPLSVPLGQRRRGCTVLDVRAGGHLVRVLSMHLGLQPVQRRRHAARLLDLAREMPRAVVAGDANEDLDGSAVGILRRGLVPLGSTPPTFPADDPRSQIDLVLGSAGLVGRELEVPVAERVLAAASDHRPRLLEIDLD